MIRSRRSSARGKSGRPGPDGLLLKINGRPQGTRELPAEWIQIDELKTLCSSKGS